jgi:hypothetical protein
MEGKPGLPGTPQRRSRHFTEPVAARARFSAVFRMCFKQSAVLDSDGTARLWPAGGRAGDEPRMDKLLSQVEIYRTQMCGSDSGQWGEEFE